MKTMLLAAVAVLAIAGNAYAQTNTFDNPGDTAGATVDRYAPSTFQSGVAYAGHTGTLEEATSVADGANNRPGAYSSSFYNTQGMGFDLNAGVTNMSVELFVPGGAWTLATDARYAGFWGVAYDATNAISAYPIIEMARIAGVDTWRGWDNNVGDWINMGVASSGWHNLSIQLLTGTNQFKYTVDGAMTLLTSAENSTDIERAIFQVHNTTEGVVDTAHWDNAHYGVPEPATWAMMIFGFGMIGATLRGRRSVTA